MRIDREEKRSLKRLLVSILVIALLVTMFPYNGIGKFVARAEDVSMDSVLLDLDEFKDASVVLIRDMTAEELAADYPELQERYPNGISAEAFYQEQLAQVSETNKVVLKLTRDLELYAEIIEMETTPKGTVGVDMGTYSIYTESLSYSDWDQNYIDFYFYGEGGRIAADYNGEDSIGQLYVWLGTGASGFNFSGNIDLSYIEFVMYGGGNLIINGEDLSISEEDAEAMRYYKQGDVHFYKEHNGITKYLELSDAYFTTTDEGKEFDISGFAPELSSQAEFDIYEKGVIPSDVKINYEGTYYENHNATTDIIEISYGSLSHEASDTEVVVDALSMDATTDVKVIYDEQGAVVDRMLQIGPSSVERLLDLGYTKITFADSAIPESSVSWDNISFLVEKVLVENPSQEFSMYLDQGFGMNLHFDVAEDRELQFYNNSLASVTVSENTKVSIPWLGEMLAEGSGYTYEITFSSEPEVLGADNAYIESGSTITIKPLETGTYVTDIYWGPNVLENSSQIEYCTDGSVVITVPDFATNEALSFNIKAFTEGVLGSPYAELSAPYFSEIDDAGNVLMDWYDADFSVTGANAYVICDAEAATNNGTGWTTESIMIQEVGTQSVHFYAMDMSTTTDVNDLDQDGDVDEQVPSDSYGDRYYLTYEYKMDKESPIISDVIVTNALGKILESNGKWITEGAEVPDPLWTAQDTLTLTIHTAEAEGLDIAEYEISDGEIITQESNVYTVSGEGVYEITIKALDEFDKGTGRRPEKLWLLTVGIDTTAPELLFTDAMNPTASVLESNRTYEGNLHLVFDDGEGSGFAEINLYKMDGENRVKTNELLIQTDSGSYIAPTTEDQTYLIEIIDMAGNTTVYENITVAGYVQDITVVVGESATTYGEALSIPVTITNTSEQDLTVSLFALREDATDSVFDKEIGTLTQLAEGDTFTTTVNVPAGDAATYYAMLDIMYTSEGGTLETTIKKVYSQQVMATIEKASGTGSINIESFNYGETASPTISSDTNGTENVKIYYKAADAEDSAYVEEMPTAAGTYMVKAVFPATPNYEEVVVESQFTITRIKADDSMYVIETEPDENGIYKEDVVIKGLSGCSLCTSENGTFTESLTIGESTENYTFYVKTGTGAITEKVVLDKIVIDKSVPDDTEEPDDTETPDDSEEPDDTETPDDSEEPDDTETPDNTEEPDDTETPDNTEEPDDIEVPDNTEEPDDMENADDTEESDDSEEPEIPEPTKLKAGKVRLERGKAYRLGEGSWSVSGDSTSYAGGITFYVSSSGDYELTQE